MSNRLKARSGRGWNMVCAGVLAAAVLIGCGSTSDGLLSAGNHGSTLTTGDSTVDSQSFAAGVVRAVKWSVVREGELSIQLGAFVPYCEGVKPKPRVASVDQTRNRRRIVLTLQVRFPRGKSSSCVGYGLGLSRWVKLGKNWRGRSIYDGSTSPPALRVRGS